MFLNIPKGVFAMRAKYCWRCMNDFAVIKGLCGGCYDTWVEDYVNSEPSDTSAESDKK